MRLRRRKKPSTEVVRFRSGVPARVRSQHNALRRVYTELAAEFPDLDLGLTASGQLVRHGEATYLRRLVMPWQIRAFGYYDLLGEIKYASQFYSRALANLVLFAAEKDLETDELVPTENQDVKDALQRIKDPGGGGRSGLLADYGRLMFLVGEALLFVSKDAISHMEQWEMLSTDELRLLDGSYTRFMAPTLPAMLFKPAPDDAFEPVADNEAVAYRLHRRHPRFSAIADSTLEGALDICEELVLLTQVVRARARSRMATAGILFLDDRISTRPSQPTPDDDPLEDPFLEDLTEAVTSPITDEGTASAVVPLIARVKVPEGMKLSDLVYHLQIVDPMQVYPETGLRTECIRRLAIVLDMPPEVLLGVATVNHWGAWMIDEQSWKVHLQPVAQGLVEDLTSAYLQPYLREQGIDDWDRYYVDYDASKVINHPDRTKDALALYGEGLLGDEAVRDAAGFDEEDAPTMAELARVIGTKVRDASLAWYGIPSVKAGGIEPEAGEVVQGGEVTSAPTSGSEGADTTKGPPSSGPNEPGDEQVLGAALVAAQIEGIAQFALLRTMEAAGSRLRTVCRKDGTLSDMIDGQKNRDVAKTLGRARVRALVGDEGQLVMGARDVIADTLRVFQITDEEVVAVIIDTIERHACRTLYEPSPLPPTFAGYVTGLLAARRSGG